MSAPAPLGGWRWASLAFRLFAITLVLVSPWLAPTQRPSDQRSIVYVVDRSASMGDSGRSIASSILAQAWAERGDARLGAVAFDGRAELIARVGAPAAPVLESPKTEDGALAVQASDLAAGIRLAHGALPHEGHRTIVLLSDLRQTRGDVAKEVRLAAEHGIRIDVVPLDGEIADLPLVTSVKPRAAHVAEKQPITLDVEVLTDGPFSLVWSRDGAPMRVHHEYNGVGRRKHGFFRKFGHAGDVEDDKAAKEPTVVQVELSDPSPPGGVHVYDVKAIPFGRPKKETENLASTLTAVSVEGRAHAAVFSSTSEVPSILRSALEASGLEVRPLPIERAADPSSYTGADLVVLADVRVSGASTDESGFTRAAQSALVDYVKEGAGLLVTGGAFGLAPEYAGTPLSRALPVEIEDRGHVEDPPVGLAIMLDRSGSMGMTVGTHTKIELAIEASLAAADVLRGTDQLAIGSVDTETHWDVPLGPVERVAALKANVRRVEAGGGGIYVFTALKDAYAALEPVKMPIRHVILFSDTSDSEEQTESCPGSYEGCPGGRTAEQLAKQARAKGITTTVVGIGEEEASDTPFLKRLAASAGGRFYLTSEGTDLRRIFLSETRVLAQSNLREKRTPVVRAGAHPILEGVDTAKLPPVSAYVETGARAGADNALLLGDGSNRPLLASWRYGLGKVGAITTDLESGIGEGWATAPSAAQVLRQSVRFLVRQHDAHRADATVKLHDRIVEVEVELAPDAPETAAPKTVEVYAVEKSGNSKKITMRLEQRGPGHWVARGRSAGEPIAIARVRDGRGALMAEAVGREDRVNELTGVAADEQLAAELTRIGEGRLRPSVADTLTKTMRPGRELRATWPYALLAAAVLVVLDLVLRRFGGRSRSTALAGAGWLLPPSKLARRG